MKRIELLLLGTLLSQAAFAQTGGRHYLYSYDSAGNIISRTKTNLNNRQKNDDEINKLEKGGKVRIKTDDSWAEVLIEIMEEVKKGDVLTIYTSEGRPVTTFQLQSNTLSLNLSELREGTYFFRFKLNRKQLYYKFVKTN